MDYDLSAFSAKPNETERIKEIDEHEYRDKFQRDRDRVLYSKEFRRLSGKTQIFVAGSDDNIRTRLTHTLEVAQIADTIARRLNLNVMLTSAIAYAHDIGHTPFGHVGERTLNFFMNGCYAYYGYDNALNPGDKGFKHNLQSVRVACDLEDMYKEEGHGLNLTRYTLWGIQNHSSRAYKDCEFYNNSGTCRYKNSNEKCDGDLSVDFYSVYSNRILNDKRDWTLEGIIVAYADEIAQRHHDIEDGIFAGILDIDHLCEYIESDPVFGRELGERIKNCPTLQNRKKNGIQDTIPVSGQQNYQYSVSDKIRALSRIIVDYYVTKYCDTLCNKVNRLHSIFQDEIDKAKQNPLKWKELFYDHIKKEGQSLTQYFGFEEDISMADKDFNHYLRNHVLFSELAQSMDGKAAYIIKQLIKAYLTNPQQLPDKTIVSVISDWYNRQNVMPKMGKPYMTVNSSARDKLKELLTSNDPIIKTLLMHRICDFIAGMTDQYAYACYDKLYGTH